MKRVHSYQHIVSLVTFSMLLGACGAARVESTNSPSPTATSTVPAATAIPTLSPNEFMARQNPVDWLEWSADGKTLVVYAHSGLYRFDTQGNPAAHPFEKGDGFHFSMAFDQQENLLLADDRVWDVATGKIRYQIAVEHLYRVYRVDFSPDGKTLAVGEDNRISLWDAATGQFKKSIGVGLGNPFWGLSFNADGSKLYATYEDGKVRQADLASGKFVERFNLPKGGCCTIFSPDTQTVLIHLSKGGEGHKELWNVENPKMVINAEHCDSDVSLTAFSADSKYFVTGPCGMDAQLWDIQARQIIHRFPSHSPGTTHPEWRSAAFSPNGSQLALANDIGEVQIWDLTSYQLLQTLNIPNPKP